MSGPGTRALLDTVCLIPGGFPPPRRARLAWVTDGPERIDEVLLTFFRGPRSYTGEDSAELSGHGNPLLAQRILERLCAAGGRLARPGEFTRRAFLNGRLSLLEAESVQTMIESRTLEGVKRARRSGGAELEEHLQRLRAQITGVAAELEASLDYPGEEGMSEAQQLETLHAAAEKLRHLQASYVSNKSWIDGFQVALVGPVNAGKSSLFNALVGSERALVSDIPGTTRDVLERSLLIQGIRITLLDTAGERRTEDPLERRGQALGRGVTEEADLSILVWSSHSSWEPELEARLWSGRPLLRVWSQCDRDEARPAPDTSWLPCSAVTGEGLAQLKAELVQRLTQASSLSESWGLTTQRQAQLAGEASQHLVEAGSALESLGGPVVAVEALYLALEHLGELDGHDVREQVLDRLFSQFCIGK